MKCALVKIPRRGKAPFLTSKHVENDDLVKIVDKPYIVPAEKSQFKKERTVLTVSVKRTSDILRWGINNTTNDRLVDAFGEDGDLWVDKEVKIHKRIENVRGQDRPVIYGIPSTQQPIAPAEEKKPIEAMF